MTKMKFRRVHRHWITHQIFSLDDKWAGRADDELFIDVSKHGDEYVVSTRNGYELEVCKNWLASFDKQRVAREFAEDYAKAMKEDAPLPTPYDTKYTRLEIA